MGTEECEECVDEINQITGYCEALVSHDYEKLDNLQEVHTDVNEKCSGSCSEIATQTCLSFVHDCDHYLKEIIHEKRCHDVLDDESILQEDENIPDSCNDWIIWNCDYYLDDKQKQRLTARMIRKFDLDKDGVVAEEDIREYFDTKLQMTLNDFYKINNGYPVVLQKDERERVDKHKIKTKDGKAN